METVQTAGPSLLHATGALLLVIGLIIFAAWIFRRFAFDGQLQQADGWQNRLGRFLTGRVNNTPPQLKLLDSLWLDARYRVVLIQNRTQTHTVLLGPQQAILLADTALAPTDHLQTTAKQAV